MNDQSLPVADTTANADALVELGLWLGRHHAFAWIASKCSAADAYSLRKIRDGKFHRKIHLSWEDFCKQHTGVTSKTADQVIDRLEEFGRSYFDLSEILHVTVPEYRVLQPGIEKNVLEFEGRKIPLTEENAPELIKVVRKVRAELERVRQEAARPPLAGIQARVDRCLGEISGLIRRGPAESDRASLLVLLELMQQRAFEFQDELTKPE